MLIENNIKDFILKTASNEPVPGGGSIAALGGALSGALGQMVANLTIGKKKYQDVEVEMLETVEILEKKVSSLLDLIDKDAKSFDGVMAAMKLPKETDEQKSLRKQKIEDASKDAAMVPLETAKLTYSLFTNIKLVVNKGNKNAVTDGLTAAMLARTSILAALLNVKINLGGVSDEEFVNSIEKEITILKDKTLKSEKEILELRKDLLEI